MFRSRNTILALAIVCIHSTHGYNNDSARKLLKPAIFPLVEKGCTNADSFGWPKFHTRDELVTNTKWASYFKLQYGNLPDTYPVCVYDFSFINPIAYNQAGLAGSRPLVNISASMRSGDLFRSEIGYGIYHPMWKPVPNNTWVEVAHTVFPTELVGAWVWTARGTGIWANVGKTKVFPTPADRSKIHQEAIAWLRKGCSVPVSNNWPQMESDVFGKCAREKGYDSIQFEPQNGEVPVGTFGMTGLTEMVLVNMDGCLSCGVPDPADTPLRAGWAASSPCTCVDKPMADSCGLMAKPPPPIIFEEPPLCKLRAENRSASCSGYTCATWTCSH
eukprot:m.1637925 g.1637925  ORF g.1637925 m.1637925 type:complete len:331 (+) comp26360_c0_seq1:273-1265(+)